MTDVRSISASRYFALTSEHVVAQGFWIVTFALATALGAQLEIPHQPVPYTFQTFFVILAGGMLGRRNALLSMTLYLTAGVLGAPVFSGGGFGLAKLLGPTGGYLIGFPFAALLISSLISLRPGLATRDKGGLRNYLLTYGWTCLAVTSGLLLVFLAGTIQLNAVYFHNWSASFQSGFLIFSWWDLLKLAAATTICVELRRS